MMLTRLQAKRLAQVLGDAPLNTCRVVQRDSYQEVVVTLWGSDGETIMSIDWTGEQKFMRLPK